MFLWGVAYVFLHPVSAFGVNPYVVQVIFGLCTVFVNGLALLVSSWSHLLFEWKPLQNVSICFYIMGYSLCLTVGGLLYFLATKIPGVQSSILTAVTSCYFLVTIAFAWPLFQEYLRLNLYFAVPGVLLCTTGIVLLALA